MDPNIQFDAPWDGLLKGITTFCLLILAGNITVGIVAGPEGNLVWHISMIGVPLVILIPCMFFVIRGFAIDPDGISVFRLGWVTRIPLAALEDVYPDAEAMSRSIRTWGNGGLFCYAGFFRNKKLGSYRAYVTSRKHAVVLKFSDRTIVMSPGDPDAFVAQVRSLKGL